MATAKPKPGRQAQDLAAACCSRWPCWPAWLAWFYRAPIAGYATTGTAYRRADRLLVPLRRRARRSADCEKDFEPGMELVILSEDPRDQERHRPRPAARQRHRALSRRATAACSSRGTARRPRSPRSSRRRPPARRHRAPPPGPARRRIRAAAKRIVAAAPSPSGPSSVTGTGLASERTLAVSGTSGSGPMRLVSTSRAAPTASRRFGPDPHFGRRGIERRRHRAARPARRSRARAAGRRCSGSRPRCSPEHCAGLGMDDPPGPRAFGPQRARRSARSRRRARSRCPGCRAWRRPRRPKLSAMRRTSLLGQPAQREAQEVELRLGRRVEEIATGRAPDRARGAARARRRR